MVRQSSRRLLRQARLLAVQAEIAGLLITVRLALGLLPFQTVYRAALRVRPARRAAGMSPHAWLHQVTRSIDAMGRALHGDSACLTQALVALVMLRRQGLPAALRIGVRKLEDGSVQAHAWLESQEAVVVGGADLARYTPLHGWEQAGL